MEEASQETVPEEGPLLPQATIPLALALAPTLNPTRMLALTLTLALILTPSPCSSRPPCRMLLVPAAVANSDGM